VAVMVRRLPRHYPMRFRSPIVGTWWRTPARAFLDAVRKSMHAIRSAIGTPTITPELLTSAEKLR
jgi:hypothetical protein